MFSFFRGEEYFAKETAKPRIIPNVLLKDRGPVCTKIERKQRFLEPTTVTDISNYTVNVLSHHLLNMTQVTI